ncbi:MAG: hypothetical protein ACON4T_09995 [Synechococcus sp.]
MAQGLRAAVRLLRERLFRVVPSRSPQEGKRAYTKRLIAETTEDAYEVVCGLAGCVLKKKDQP